MVDEFRVIESRAEYLAAVEQLANGTGPVAVDAERASGFRYSQRAYLIQAFRRGSGTFLFDPPAIGDFSELQNCIGDTEWVLHAASQDLACLREVGLDPSQIFDTELAARLLGMPRVGLGAVVEELLGITLAKEHSAADWSTRPLPQPWLRYAALDVDLLIEVRDEIARRLDEQHKSEIAAQEFDAVLHRQPKPTPAEPWRRLSGIHSLRSPRALAVARSLWLSRDRLAIERDVSPGRLVPDAAILAAVKAMPDSQRALADLKGFTGRASRSELVRWWEAIDTGRTTEELPVMRVPHEGPPPPRGWAHRHPDADARLRAAKARLVELADAQGMPLENLLTPDLLRRVAWRPPAELTAELIGQALTELGARPWQVDSSAQQIAEAFVEAEQSVEASPEDPS